MKMPFTRRTTAVALLGLTLAACVVVSTRTGPFALGRDHPEGFVRSPVKAHVLDGSTIVFADGAFIEQGRVRGRGIRVSPLLEQGMPAEHVISLDSVAGMEVYERRMNARTLVYAPVTAAASVVGAAALMAVIFGSCPTVYADSAGQPTLQAESFSYSIAPLLEKRDVDRLHVVADAGGIIRLNVRNEAAETHYTDQLALVEVRHAAGETVYPAAKRGPVAMRDMSQPLRATDAAGRDVARIIASADGNAFVSDDGILARAVDGGAPNDYIELAIPRPAGRDSIAIALTARSSLLSTVAFYDHMLARPGVHALQWLGTDLKKITSAAQLARWYAQHMGMRVQVRDGSGWSTAVRLMDFGPAAWRRIAVVVPARGDTVRVRLDFVADGYRIDEVRTSWDFRDAEERDVVLARVTDMRGTVLDSAGAVLRKVDDRRLEVRPGQQYLAHFEPGRAAPGTRTYFLAAHGYYTEWVRGSWLKSATDSTAFKPNERTLRSILRQWQEGRDSMEVHFFAKRVPVA
jgi:hypothetical protein